MKKITEFFGNIKQELKRITWPTDKEMKESTTQVFVFMIILAVFFAGVDAIISAGVVVATRPTPIVEETPDTDDDANYDYDAEGDYYYYDDAIDEDADATEDED